MSQNDPTDNALAAIASILDNPEPPPLPEAQKPSVIEEIFVERPVVEDEPLVPEMIQAEGYSKVGPGPMEAIRFKWTVRRDDNGDYFVDETIGQTSAAIVNGPMNRDAAIRLVDDRESEARQRFDQFKSEMTGRNAVANLVRRDSGEM